MFAAVSWLAAISLISLERRRQLPIVPTRGHGVSLLLYWVLAFAFLNSPFISWFSTNYWWRLDR